MEIERRKDIEDELSKLGWSQPGKADSIRVYQEYRPKKDKPWSITVYSKVPVWKWDFVTPAGTGPVEFLDYSPEPGTWIRNMRDDLEFESVEDAAAVAKAFNDEREDWYDNEPFPTSYHHWDFAVQRVTERP